MKRLALRNSLCCLMVFLLPASLMATEEGAIAYVSGSTSVNGVVISRSSVVFPGDVIQTKTSSQANISVAGTSITIFQDSLVAFATNGVVLEDGSVHVGTTKRDMTSKAGVVTVTPASQAWTEFEMSRLNGAVQIIARKGNVNVSEGTEIVTLFEGQSATRGDSASSDGSTSSNNKHKRDKAPAPAAARASGIDSPILIGVGAAAIGTGLIYALTRSSSPISPVTP
jgi:hypothetical protein